MTAALQTRAPSGRVPWPLVLVDGEHLSGKQWAVAELATSDRVGDVYWAGVGESAADQYGAITGARHQVVEHDGTFAGLLAQLHAVRDAAQSAADAGQRPTVLALTGMHDLWAGLKDWTSTRARSSRAGREALLADPHADVRAGSLWQDAAHRHALIMNVLLQFPGIVVITSRSSRNADTGDWTVDAHWSVVPAATAWLRTHRGAPAEVIGGRSVRAGLETGGVRGPVPADADGRLLEWLIFDELGIDGGIVPLRDVRPLLAGELLPEERAPEAEPARPGRPAPTPDRQAGITPEGIADEASRAQTVDHLDRLVRRTVAARSSNRFTDADVETVRAAVSHRRTQLTAQEGPR